MTYSFNPDFPDATNDQKWEQIRNWRNAELEATDWTQVDDSPVDKAAWSAYRQELRDLPTSVAIADDVIIPVRP